MLAQGREPKDWGQKLRARHAQELLAHLSPQALLTTCSARFEAPGRHSPQNFVTMRGYQRS